MLAACNGARIGVVPHGGNTGYCGGATPDETGTQLVLSLARLNRVRGVDPENYSLVAEAGCLLAEVQRAAAAAGRHFPLSLGSEGSCQIGGNLSTNAGGVHVLRYGMMRDLVLGLEVVLPDGRVLPGLSALRKDNTGYGSGRCSSAPRARSGSSPPRASSYFPRSGVPRPRSPRSPIRAPR